jgi:ABC-type Fe3+ transport system substrate-binding protein
LKTGRNQENADAFLAYLATDRAQDIYAKYGFGKASAEELKIEPLPSLK